MSSKQGKRYFFNLVLLVPVAYILSILAAIGLSIAYVEESYSVEAMNIIQQNPQCSFLAKRKTANIFNPVDFYANHRYWLASLRLSDKAIGDGLCLSRITESVLNFPKKVSVVFVNDHSEIVFSISNY